MSIHVCVVLLLCQFWLTTVAAVHLISSWSWYLFHFFFFCLVHEHLTKCSLVVYSINVPSKNLNTAWRLFLLIIYLKYTFTPFLKIFFYFFFEEFFYWPLKMNRRLIVALYFCFCLFFLSVWRKKTKHVCFKSGLSGGGSDSDLASMSALWFLTPLDFV